MAKDYAKKSKPTRKRKKKQQQRPSAKLILLAVALVAVFGTGLWYLKTKAETSFFSKHAPSTRYAGKKHRRQRNRHRASAPLPPKPRFEFYSILPKDTVSTNTVTPPKSVNTAKPQGRYIIQVASVRNPSDADKLKAELTLEGFNVIIKPMAVNGVKWYRIQIGPFNQLAKANKTQRQLQAAHHKTIVKTLTA